MSIHFKTWDGNNFTHNQSIGGLKWSGHTRGKLLQLPIMRLNKSPKTMVRMHPKPGYHMYEIENSARTNSFPSSSKCPICLSGDMRKLWFWDKNTDKLEWRKFTATSTGHPSVLKPGRVWSGRSFSKAASWFPITRVIMMKNADKSPSNEPWIIKLFK